jgi:uncharacterized protein
VTDLLLRPWPWYVAGPLLGLFVPLLLLLGNRLFGVSGNLRHICAAACPADVAHFRYDWRSAGGWNLAFAAGILIGGFIAGFLLANPDPVAISPAAQTALAQLGISDFDGLVPADVFSWSALLDVRLGSLLVLGGLLIGFGTAYAGGCTSGHGLTGVADLQPASFLALAAFFAGGVAGTFLLLPLFLRGG